jgi:hypothetical protein
VSYSTYPAIFETIDLVADKIRPQVAALDLGGNATAPRRDRARPETERSGEE